MKHPVKILSAAFITHDVKQFNVEKPEGYSFVPGQATDVSVNLPDWKDEVRPFTFTSLNEWPHLQFTTKIYPERNGVTNQLGKLNTGAELIIDEPFGVIHYKGPGVFIAGGAGVTPFIAIFRKLNQLHQLDRNTLVFSNKTSADVILGNEFSQMLGERFITIFTREKVIGFRDRRIDRDFLIDKIGNFGQPFYVCGPDEFVKQITDLLIGLGASPESVIFEK